MVWGGARLYTQDKLPALFDALYKYQTVKNKDPYANLMLQAFTTNKTANVLLKLAYMKPEPTPPAFAPFYNISAVVDNTKVQTVVDLLNAQGPELPR